MKKQKNLELVAIGCPSVSALTESEQKHFYITLLTRILELIKEKKWGGVNYGIRRNQSI